MLGNGNRDETIGYHLNKKWDFVTKRFLNITMFNINYSLYFLPSMLSIKTLLKNSAKQSDGCER